MDGFDERLLKGLAKQSSNWDLIQSMYEDWMGIKPPRPEPKLALIDLDYSAAERRVQAMFDESSLDPFNWDNLVMRNWLSSESPLSPSAVTRRLFPEGDKTVTGRSTRRFPLQHLPRLTEEKIMKSPEMQKFLDNLQAVITGGDTTNQAAFEERCVKPPLGCGEFLAKKNPFPTPAYKREYRITGMCSPCQDKFQAQCQAEEDPDTISIETQNLLSNIKAGTLPEGMPAEYYPEGYRGARDGY
jgi:hypothetical protein